MQADITHMQSDITHMQADITHMQSDISHMQSDITHIKREVSDSVVLIQATAEGVKALGEKQTAKHLLYDEKFAKLKAL
jgi:peptidoglycan hydrolase CwlO-like protein